MLENSIFPFRKRHVGVSNSEIVDEEIFESLWLILRMGVAQKTSERYFFFAVSCFFCTPNQHFAQNKVTNRTCVSSQVSQLQSKLLIPSGNQT